MTTNNNSSASQIEIMTAGGALLGRILSRLIQHAQPGITPLELNQLALDLISKAGASPSFTTVPGYDWAICLNINSGVVHGIPTANLLVAGQLVSLDIGLIYRDYHVDMSESFIVSGAKSIPNAKIKKHLLQAGREVLNTAIKRAKAGRRIGHISQAIEQGFVHHNLQPIKTLTGHAIGRRLHQDPMIPQYLSSPISRTPRLIEGMTLAIEVIYSSGSSEMVVGSDNWTLSTKDTSLAGLFERTIVVTPSGGQIITPLPSANDFN